VTLLVQFFELFRRYSINFRYKGTLLCITYRPTGTTHVIDYSYSFFYVFGLEGRLGCLYSSLYHAKLKGVFSLSDLVIAYLYERSLSLLITSNHFSRILSTSSELCIAHSNFYCAYCMSLSHLLSVEL
jgi:hypothetical protein